jgi:hypothetical protein
MTRIALRKRLGVRRIAERGVAVAVAPTWDTSGVVAGQGLELVLIGVDEQGDVAEVVGDSSSLSRY